MLALLTQADNETIILFGQRRLMFLVRHPINCRMMLLRCIYVCGKVIPFCNCILTEDASTAKNAKLNLGS